MIGSSQHRWLKRPTPNASHRCPPTFKSSTVRTSRTLLLLRPLSVGRFASLRFRSKNMAHHIFQLESELQNIPEAAPEASLSFRVSEKLARYGSSALSGLEHLTLLVGKESVALAPGSSFWFAQRSGSRHPSRNYGNSFHGVR
jgi:hypothetical protein